jgi:lipopolysaccharide/colanic/teichoic acid biosynthesis glycosyltransferase
MYPLIKRFFDFFFSLLLLFLLAPLLIPVMVLLRLTAEGEVFYKQKRIGYNNQVFMIWKFATMLKNSPNMKGGELTLRNDPRVTTMGKFLRITKLNELPQLINVLKGDMSFVGPRPLMPISFEQYAPEIQAVVYNSKPGITGIGSVIFRDEEKLVTESGMDPWEFYKWHIFPLKGALEQWYQKKKSFYTDVMLLFLTAWVILFPHSKLPYTIFPQLPKI